MAMIVSLALVFMTLSAGCSTLPVATGPYPDIPVTADVVPDEPLEVEKKRKPPAPAPVRKIIVKETAPPTSVLLPPCAPESGNKKADVLRLLDCVIETADKPPVLAPKAPK